MAKLFHILAASVGSGLVLGASIRLGEALGSRIQAEMAHPGVNGDRPIEPPPAARKPAGDPISPPFLSRLDRLEAKLSQSRPRQARPSVADAGSGSEWQSVVAGMVARMDRQQSDVDSIRQQVAKATQALDSAGNIANHLRSDLQNELDNALDKRLEERLAALETRIHLKMEASQNQTMDAMVNAMENRMAPRIIRMENEIEGQTAAVSELRECALQSERSVQRLIGVLEHLVTPSRPSEPAPSGAAQPSATPVSRK